MTDSGSLVPTGFVAVDQSGVAHADTQEEPTGMCRDQRRVARRDLRRVVHPEVEDPGRDRDPLGGVEQGAAVAEHVTADTAGYPQRGVPEAFELRGRVERRRAIAVPQPATPDSRAATGPWTPPCRCPHGSRTLPKPCTVGS